LAPNYQKINKIIKKVEKLNNEITKLRLRIARKTKQRKHWLRCLKDIRDVESKNILKIEKDKREIKNAKKMFEALFDTNINLFLFALLFSSALSSLISEFVVDEIVATC